MEDVRFSFAHRCLCSALGCNRSASFADGVMHYLANLGNGSPLLQVCFNSARPFAGRGMADEARTSMYEPTRGDGRRGYFYDVAFNMFLCKPDYALPLSNHAELKDVPLG